MIRQSWQRVAVRLRLALPGSAASESRPFGAQFDRVIRSSHQLLLDQNVNLGERTRAPNRSSDYAHSREAELLGTRHRPREMNGRFGRHSAGCQLVDPVDVGAREAQRPFAPNSVDCLHVVAEVQHHPIKQLGASDRRPRACFHGEGQNAIIVKFANDARAFVGD